MTFICQGNSGDVFKPKYPSETDGTCDKIDIFDFTSYLKKHEKSQK